MKLHSIDGDTDLSKLQISNLQLVESIVSATKQMYTTVGSFAPWIGYLAEEGGWIVGACGFKGPPDDQAVEIAYFTFPEFENQGVATRMAESMIEIARLANPSMRVLAQTLPERNASHRVLEKLQFKVVGMKQHEIDGKVVEWCLDKSAASSNQEGR